VRLFAASALAVLALPAFVRAGHVAPAPPPVVTVRVSNPSISPNDDGVRDRTRIEVSVDSKATLSVAVDDAHGAVVTSLVSAQPVGAGRQELAWNGKGSGGRVADGPYTVVANAVGPGGAEGRATALVSVDTTAPRVTWLGPSARRVFRGVLPIDVVVGDALSSRAHLRLTLRDQTGRKITDFAPSPRPLGALRLGWHPSSGLPSGAYRVEVRVTDDAGNIGATGPRPFLVERHAHPRTVAHVDDAGRKVALTFDDCGSQAAWASILRTLRDRGVKAAFFCPGIYVLAAPDLARETVRDGHTIGSHGWDHVNFRGLSSSEARKRLVADREVWWRLARVAPTPFFRPPYGAYTRATYAVAGTVGYSDFVLWDVDPSDWKDPGVRVIVARVLRAVRPGSIVLLHVKPQTASALPAILRGLLAKRLEPVALADLLHAGRPTALHWPAY